MTDCSDRESQGVKQRRASAELCCCSVVLMKLLDELEHREESKETDSSIPEQIILKISARLDAVREYICLYFA